MNLEVDLGKWELLALFIQLYITFKNIEITDYLHKTFCCMDELPTSSIIKSTFFALLRQT